MVFEFFHFHLLLTAHRPPFYQLLLTGFGSLCTLSPPAPTPSPQVLLLSNVALFCVSLVSLFVRFFPLFCSLLALSFLKLHQGSRTHAQLPRRPVPPPKPRRSKKGVSRCGTWLSISEPLPPLSFSLHPVCSSCCLTSTQLLWHWGASASPPACCSTQTELPFTMHGLLPPSPSLFFSLSLPLTLSLFYK